MTRKDIVTLPHENLRRRSKKVGIITDEVKQLVDDMIAATLDWEDSRKHELGVALAAIQVDRLFRIIVVRNNFDDRSDRSFHAFINPEIIKFEGAIIEDFEGCLSVKDIYGKVPRYEKVRLKALDENGRQIRLKAEGFLARVFQHEIDHNNGIMFIDHIKEKEHAYYKLTEDGQLEKLDYEKDIKNNSILWE
jgi:peptide deformylase